MAKFVPQAREKQLAKLQSMVSAGRMLLLAMAILAAMVNALVTFWVQEVTSTLVKIYGYTIAVYAGLLTIYAAFALWKTWRYSRKQPLALEFQDTLTGLLNWKGLVLAFDTDVRRRKRSRPAQLVHVHLRNLDLINFERGNTAGDTVLLAVAQLLQEHSPPRARVGRISGAEFLVIMPDSTASEAEATADHILQAVQSPTAAGLPSGSTPLSTAVTPVKEIAPGETLKKLIAKVRATSIIKASADDPHVRCVHVPRVCLGAFAARAWDNLDRSVQQEFMLWRREPSDPLITSILKDMMWLLHLDPTAHYASFVTIRPFSPEADKAEQAALRLLAQKIAGQLEVPYRDVFRASPTSFIEGNMSEPEVDTQLEPGSSILIVHDLIENPAQLRACVKKLADAGANARVIAGAVR